MKKHSRRAEATIPRDSTSPVPARAPVTASGARRRRWVRGASRLSYELERVLGALRMRLVVANVLFMLVPTSSLTTLRAAAYRAVGFDIAPRVSFMNAIAVTGTGRGIYQRLTIGEGTFVGTSALFNLDARIVIGQNVSIGPFVRIYTSTHVIGPATRRRSPRIVTRPVVIEDGVWIGVEAIILPGVTIGAGSVVGGGSVVREDVAPNTLVSGVPAVFVRHLALDGGDDPSDVS